MGGKPLKGGNSKFGCQPPALLLFNHSANHRQNRSSPPQSEAKMRRIIYAINITLDGCCDHTKMSADAEVHEYFTHLMRDVATGS
jgi:hypothetical protein